MYFRGNTPSGMLIFGTLINYAGSVASIENENNGIRYHVEDVHVSFDGGVSWHGVDAIKEALGEQ